MTAIRRRYRQRDGIGIREGRGWARTGWAASLLVLLLYAGLAVVTGAAHAEAGLPSAATPVRVPSGPGVHFHPTIAVDRHGYATVAWVQQLFGDDGTSEAEIRLAQAPEWNPVTVAATPIERAATLRPLLAVDDVPHLAWTEPSTTTVAVWRYAHGGGEAPVVWDEAVPYTAVLATDAGGGLRALWAEGNALILIDDTVPLTSSLTLDVSLSPADIDLAIDASGHPHAAWAGRLQIDEDPGIYYAALDVDATPTRVDDVGLAPRLIVGPLGTAHLCWRRAEGLHCADSRDWGRVGAVAPALPDERVALAVGPNDVAHVAWSVDGALWYANSGNWAASRRRLADLDASQVSMAIDAAGRPHLAVTVEAEGGGNDLFVLTPMSPEPQLAVVAPTSGAWLASGDPLVAVTNLPAAEWQRVSFYLRPNFGLGAAFEDALIPIGTDYDGRDGWSVPFDAAAADAAAIDATTLYHTVAVGVDVRGGVTSAVGDPVAVLPPGGDDVWVLNPGPEIVQGLGQAWVMTPGADADLVRLEVSLTAPGCPFPQRPDEHACSIPSRTFLVASVGVDSSKARPDREWLPVTYDSRALPDGTYRLSATAIDRDGGERVGVAAKMVSIDNGLAPLVRVIEPRSGATVWGAFRVAAEAQGRASPVQRVDFYAERQRTLLQRTQGLVRHTVGAPDVVWLGSDVDGSDGWGIGVTAAPHLDGDAWVLRAVAYDDRGRSALARSEGTFTIVGRDRPALYFSRPPPGSEVTGGLQVTIHAAAGSRYVVGIDLYAETPDERLIPLGVMEERGGRWVRDWNSAELPDGDYDLMAVARHADGRSSLVRGGTMCVRNVWGGYGFVEPGPDDVLRGAATLRLLRASGAEQASEVSVFYRDAAGELRPIGPATPGDDGWTLVWDTAGVLDGAYDLVAVVHGPGEQVRFAERRVEVSNVAAPSLVTWPFEGEVISGMQDLAWRAGGDARVALDWSPDGGVHWVRLADDLDAEGRFEWDTTRVPDTPLAVLRLTAGDGGCWGMVQSGPFTIDNVDESPIVALLAPEQGEAYGSPVFVAWRAWDPDGDPLVADLDYRRGLGAWQPLARDLAGSGSFSWDTSGLEPAADYVLRVTVRDPAGGNAALNAASAEVSDLSLLTNRPPQVRLVTPNARALLRGDSVILWQAEDPDDDPLLIDLYYSDDAGQTWLPLAEGIANTGYYMWQVSFLPMGGSYRLRVVARDGFYRVSDDSDGTFVVGGTLPPTLFLLRPIGGDRVAGVVPVQWGSGMTAATTLTATVSVRSAGDVVWRPLLKDAPDDGLFMWDTTTLPDGVYELMVTIGDGQDETAVVASVTVANRRNERPEVTLLSPAGGERWCGIREIVWRARDNDGDPLSATVSISADGGTTWQELATVDAGEGRHIWDTGALRGVHPLLARVVVSDGQVTAQAVTPAPFYLANGVSGPSIHFVSPDADGNLWRDRIVAWEAGSMGGAPPRVSLALRRDDGAGRSLGAALSAAADGAVTADSAMGASWQPVVEAAFDAGEAVVADGWLKPGHSYRLRLIADDGAWRVSGISAPFEVATAGSEPPVVTLEQPSGGEVWSGVHEVRWQAQTPDDRELGVTLELSRDGGATWFDLARGQANAGRYSWDTATVANGIYRLRLTAGDDRAESAVVSLPFEVDNPGREAPVLSLVSPGVAETWAGTREVRWRVAGADADALSVTLAYSLDGGGTWRRFAFNVPASEGYLWDTTTVPNGDVVWLRATVSDGEFSAEDYAGPFIVRNPRGPVVALLAPVGGEQWAGEQRVVWYTAHEAGRTPKTMLQYSLDRGRTWETIAHDLPARGSYRWDMAAVTDYAGVLVRAYVSDGQQSAVGATRAPLRVRHLPPRVETPFYLP